MYNVLHWQRYHSHQCPKSKTTWLHLKWIIMHDTWIIMTLTSPSCGPTFIPLWPTTIDDYIMIMTWPSPVASVIIMIVHGDEKTTKKAWLSFPMLKCCIFLFWIYIILIPQICLIWHSFESSLTKWTDMILYCIAKVLIHLIYLDLM